MRFPETELKKDSLEGVGAKSGFPSHVSGE